MDGEQEPRLLCAECGAPLAAELDCFAALGLPRKLTLDPARLERRYHELSRKIHPDRFASKGPKVRDASLRATALLTRSYRTLRDPVSRGLYWLELNGEKLAENNKRVPRARRAGVRGAGATGRAARGASGPRERRTNAQREINERRGTASTMEERPARTRANLRALGCGLKDGQEGAGDGTENGALEDRLPADPDSRRRPRTRELKGR